MTGFGCLGHKRIAVAGNRDLLHFLDVLRNRRIIVADDVSDNHHLRINSPAALRRVVNRMQVTVIQVFQAGKHDALWMGVKELRDLVDRWTGVTGGAVKLKTNGLSACRHLVKNEASRSNNAVAPFFLQTE